jgi:hypothetical protein
MLKKKTQLKPHMDTFAETAIANYRLSFAVQGKQTELCRFGFPFAENKQK